MLDFFSVCRGLLCVCANQVIINPFGVSSYTVDKGLVRITIITRVRFSKLHTCDRFVVPIGCFSALFFGLPHARLKLWNKSSFFRVNLHLCISTIFYLCFFRCVSRFFRDISVSEIVFYLHIWFAVYIGQSLSAQTFRLAFAPQVGFYWDWPLHVFWGRGKVLWSPSAGPSRTTWLCSASFSVVFWNLIHQGKQRGGEDDLRFTFFSGMCIFFSFDVSPVRTLTNNCCY